MKRQLPLAMVLMCGLATSEARAHFLFIRVGPMAEAGRSAEVYFSDRADAGDPKFVDKIARTQLWAQVKPGEFRALDVRKGPDRLRALVPSAGSVSVAGTCEYGVLARPNETPFLLRYYPKAVAGKPEELNRMAPRQDAPLEVVATFENDRVRLVALLAGKPMPGAKFVAVDLDLAEVTVTADAKGEAVWVPESSGTYAIYTRHDTKQEGEAGGKHYEEIREFATLSLDWPLVRTDADPEAVSVFRQALAARAQWKDFPGFVADASGSFEGAPFAGSISVTANGVVTTEGIHGGADAWVKDQLRSIAMHRSAEAHDAPEPVLRYGDDGDDHPLGRLLLFEGGEFASSYRVKDRQITQVNRHIGRMNMTITTLENERNAEGLFLPRNYVVQSWDAETGALKRVDTVQDRWVRLGGFDLSAARTVTSATDGGQNVRSLTLTGHKLASDAGSVGK